MMIARSKGPPHENDLWSDVHPAALRAGHPGKTREIQRAEGEREAVIQVAQGKAEAIRLVNEAAEKYFIGNAQLLKRMEMTENSPRECQNCLHGERD